MDKIILTTCKEFINNTQDEELKEYINEYIDVINQESDYRLPYEYIFQQIYIHTCLKKNESLAKWLKEEIHDKYFDIIQKVALRQMFIYGNYLLKK